MERLYLPPSLRYLEPMRVVRGAPLDHTSFAYDLVTAVRPRLVVDVGTGAGMFMAIACQAMREHDIDGLVHGIDAWSDDEGKPEDDETRWADLNAFLRTHFRGIAYLMKMSHEDGVQHFADGSIDILRLNAVRAGGRLGALVDAWLPRVAKGGILICEDVNDPETPDRADEWTRATEGRPAFVFPQGKGLGVLCLGRRDGEPSPELVELLTANDVAEREGLARFYQHADRHHRFRNEVQSQGANLAKRGKK
ncbi:MAG TPA: class I SAM-dependent methyltransferase [Polyangiaceae bacterium]